MLIKCLNHIYMISKVWQNLKIRPQSTSDAFILLTVKTTVLPASHIYSLAKNLFFIDLKSDRFDMISDAIIVIYIIAEFWK